MGQLGLGHNTSWGSAAEHMENLAEVELGEGFEAAGVTCGLDHSCAWSTTGMLKCWGGNSFGQVIGLAIFNRRTFDGLFVTHRLYKKN